MKTQKLGITILSITGLILALACVFLKDPQPAPGMVTIKDRDYIVTTSAMQKGGDALYITDIRSGQMVVFMYDPATRSVVPAAGINVPGMFGK